MSIRDWFKSEASSREKATATAARLAETEAALDRLRKEASALVLDAGPGGGGAAEKRVADIEHEIATLLGRYGWQQQALTEAEARAAADEAAAEVERRRQAAEARTRLITERSQSYQAAVDGIVTARRAFLAALDRAVAAADELAQADGGAEARRLLGPVALGNRWRDTQWRDLHGWFPYPVNGAYPEVKRDLVEVEREILAELRRQDAQQSDDRPGTAA